MTREEAIVILDGFKHNPLFNEQHFEALAMAISALSAEGEYIKKSELLQHVTTEELSDYKECDVIHAEEIDELTTYSFPDSAENKGEWIDNGNGSYTCSNCKTEWTTSQIEKMCFCPTCGADMRGE